MILTLNIFHTFSSVSIVDFEQANVSWLLPCHVHVSELIYTLSITVKNNVISLGF